MKLARKKIASTVRTISASIVIATAVIVVPSRAEDPRVLFDVPDRIECRDVTPEKCAAMHPTMKVIEARFRISASFAEGSESSIVDFTYLISSPEMRLRILDYLPNTTLESQFADDRIEVADFSEESDASSQEARVAYTIFSLSAKKNQLNRKTEQNQYQRIVPKALVLASGTTNRGHGVFYKLRPSNTASLEGAKEFSFLAIVPKSWRGDWCTFVCSARTNKKTLLGSSIVTAGATKVDVGMYLCGDEQAAELATQLCRLQQTHQDVLTKHGVAEAARAMESMQSSTSGNSFVGKVDDLLHQVAKKTHPRQADEKLAAAQRAVTEVEDQLGRYSGAER